MAGPVERTAGHAGVGTRALLPHLARGRATPAKKGGAVRALDATVQLARDSGLIEATSPAAAIDSTGMDSSSASTYYSHRAGTKHHRFPKVSAVVDIHTHLILGAVIDRGPKPDDIEFHRLARQAHRRQPFDALLGDVGYDGEHHHEFLYRRLGVLGIIPPTRGRPPKSKHHHPQTFFRGFLSEHFPHELYGQRWQIETTFSMLKRTLGAALHARRAHAIDDEIFFRILTLNLMIIALIIAVLNRAVRSLLCSLSHS
jgi:transposase